jgi:hypothetical protein
MAIARRAPAPARAAGGRARRILTGAKRKDAEAVENSRNAKSPASPPAPIGDKTQQKRSRRLRFVSLGFRFAGIRPFSREREKMAAESAAE